MRIAAVIILILVLLMAVTACNYQYPSDGDVEDDIPAEKPVEDNTIGDNTIGISEDVEEEAEQTVTEVIVKDDEIELGDII